MNGSTYTCWKCKGTFAKGWTEAEAGAEALAVYNEFKPQDNRWICDVCYQEYLAWLKEFDPAAWQRAVAHQEQ